MTLSSCPTKVYYWSLSNNKKGYSYANPAPSMSTNTYKNKTYNACKYSIPIGDDISSDKCTQTYISNNNSPYPADYKPTLTSSGGRTPGNQYNSPAGIVETIDKKSYCTFYINADAPYNYYYYDTH